MLLRSFTRLYTRSTKSPVSKSFFQRYRKQIKLGIAGTAVATVLGFGYCEYVIHTTWTVELDEDQFTRYKISQRVDIDPHHYFLEAKPLSEQKINIWKKLTSNKIWSLEVKQPEIMIVRNYTPLPLKLTVNNKDDYQLEPLDIKNNDTNGGKLLFYIKNYDNGEVGRWMRNLDVGSRIDLRGPFVEYEFKDDTKNVNMYTAGTGVVSALQILLNNTLENPRTFTWVHTSHDMNELGKLYPMMINLNKTNDISLRLFSDTYSIRDNIEELMKLTPANTQNLSFNKEFMALVCGPDGFIKSLAGAKVDLRQGPLDGILKHQGWTKDNVFKL
ncbi:similar to Saccharomyces cerevisiae YOR037W CYC2 Mitochondrial peripheral inner membrane protein, contains a FAD cofactor in a domain exposed in the intermembrane space [Maudiozyma saulgeensis]|uniref:Similar to Saccharomyces cerevisiae YOR037W CYC2 Mitochondrial peripheral inner membrane protein, contains a FAD cofactor in a domain exposed in the intermembrane space n=1 Tax=Maudiozyma saulgeensis TaxID=1789683 RepID=A0A1X7QWQ8_9SACH|nr:similar to Saccharomyces cerevisiae YOR037W CYC2 Mitochondrial peripheral inner membrane protein, contains a FAD cofactor in a domain exposed in the intermembrane space [Kazachstania saulgeensis]